MSGAGVRSRRVVSGAALLLAAMLVVSACGGGGGQDAGTVSVDWSEPENPLIPGSTNEQQGGDALDQLFSGLVAYDANTADPRMANAESITSTDNRTFTIRLKPGWTFHDGTPVTSQSYVDSWNWTAAGPSGAQNQKFMQKIEGFDAVSGQQPTAPGMTGLRVVDPQTFTVTLTAPYAIFPTTLGYTAYYPVPRKFFDDRAGYEAAPVGNGPYRFKSRAANQNLILAAYDNYVGEERPQARRIEFRNYSDIQTAYDDVVSGNLDHVKIIPTPALDGNRWRTDLGPGAKVKDGLSVTALAFPLYDPRFANPLLRRAFSMAIDREALVQQASDGLWRPADGLATPAAEGFVPNQCGENCQFNPQRARELLAQAGGFQGPLIMIANSDGGHDEWMQAVAGNLRQNLGIDARYNPLPSLAEVRRLANAGQLPGISRAAWIGDYPNIETFLTPLYRTGGSSNDSRFSDPALDAALARADAARTIPEAEALYAEAERLILAQMPTLPLYSEPISFGNSSRLATGERSPLDRLDGLTFQLNPQG